MQADIKDFLTGRGIEWEEVDDLAKVAGDVDVLYQTRIQKERFQVSFARHSCLRFGCRLGVKVTGHKSNMMPPLSILGCVVAAAAQGFTPAFAMLNRQGCSTSFGMRTFFAVLQDRPQEYEEARGKYIIDNNIMQILSKSAVIMHPLPRVDEVSVGAACERMHLMLVGDMLDLPPGAAAYVGASERAAFLSPK